MNAKLILTMFAAAGSLTLLVAGAPASATVLGGQQITRYDGGSCRPSSPASAARIKIDDIGRLFNTSPTDSLEVDCPLVRDLWVNKSASVRMYVFDQKAHPGAALSCRFQMFNPLTGQSQGSSVFGTNDTPSRPSAGAAIESTLLATQNLASLHCRIPPAAADGTLQSGIGGYDFTENQ
jgi:hypothetical protein